MRPIICATLAVGALAASQALAQTPAPQPRTHHAAAAERLGVEANYVGPQPGKGYSAETRHMTNCLATYRRYDPKTDRVQVRPGVVRRCDL